MNIGIQNAIAAAVGATILYGKWGRSKLRPHFVGYLDPVIDVLNLPEKWRRFFEFVVFIVFGTYIAVRITHPGNEFQAFSAGLGWTGFAASPNTSIKQ